jgi:hypothetical protein
MDVWEVLQSSRAGLDRGFLMDVGPKRTDEVTTDKPAQPGDMGESGQPRVPYTDGSVPDYTHAFPDRWVPCRKGTDGTCT